MSDSLNANPFGLDELLGTNIPEELSSFLRHNQESLRQLHFDSHMQQARYLKSVTEIADLTPAFQLGTVGRFLLADSSIMIAVYMRVDNQVDSPAGCPVGFSKKATGPHWATTVFTDSDPSLVVGLTLSPISGNTKYAWVQISGLVDPAVYSAAKDLGLELGWIAHDEVSDESNYCFMRGTGSGVVLSPVSLSTKAIARQLESVYALVATVEDRVELIEGSGGLGLLSAGLAELTTEIEAINNQIGIAELGVNNSLAGMSARVSAIENLTQSSPTANSFVDLANRVEGLLSTLDARLGAFSNQLNSVSSSAARRVDLDSVQAQISALASSVNALGTPAVAASTKLSVPIHSDGTANIAMTNQTNAEQAVGANSRTEFQVDLTAGFTHVRLCVNIMVISASANNPRLYLQYWNGAAWTTVGTGAAPEIVVMGVLGVKLTNWIALPAGAKSDSRWRVAVNGGDGVADPQFGSIHVQFK